MEDSRLQEILKLHKKWIADEEGGVCADLSDADLSDANLRRANLSGADLSDADLSGANLSGASGVLSSIAFIDTHFERTETGYIAYKTFASSYQPSPEWKVEPSSVLTETVNPNRTNDCGCGINVAPLNWVKKYANGDKLDIWKVLIEWPWLAGVVVPYNSDGKIRCERIRLLEIVK